MKRGLRRAIDSPAGPSTRTDRSRSAHVRELAPQIRDVVLVHLDLLLIRLETIEHPLVVALTAKADALLLRKGLLRLIEQLLLLTELLLEYAATLPITLLLRLRIDLAADEPDAPAGTLFTGPTFKTLQPCFPGGTMFVNCLLPS
jgi:hypothetical protein